ncbi:hypothetical protein ACHWUR_29350 [Klebsiella pneumoniae]
MGPGCAPDRCRHAGLRTCCSARRPTPPGDLAPPLAGGAALTVLAGHGNQRGDGCLVAGAGNWREVGERGARRSRRRSGLPATGQAQEPPRWRRGRG